MILGGPFVASRMVPLYLNHARRAALAKKEACFYTLCRPTRVAQERLVNRIKTIRKVDHWAVPICIILTLHGMNGRLGQDNADEAGTSCECNLQVAYGRYKRGQKKFRINAVADGCVRSLNVQTGSGGSHLIAAPLSHSGPTL
jgi:hypothetical protein